MKVRKMRELLKEQNASASVFLDEINDLNCGLVKVAEQGNKVVLYSIAEVNGKPDTYKPSCIVSTMTLFICLKKFPDDYDVATAPKRILRSHVTMMRFLTAFRKNCMHYFKNTPKKNLPGSSFFAV